MRTSREASLACIQRPGRGVIADAARTLPHALRRDVLFATLCDNQPNQPQIPTAA